jgi:hypothetical protein
MKELCDEQGKDQAKVMIIAARGRFGMRGGLASNPEHHLRIGVWRRISAPRNAPASPGRPLQFK